MLSSRACSPQGAPAAGYRGATGQFQQQGHVRVVLQFNSSHGPLSIQLCSSFLMFVFFLSLSLSLSLRLPISSYIYLFVTESTHLPIYQATDLPIYPSVYLFSYLSM